MINSVYIALKHNKLDSTGNCYKILYKVGDDARSYFVGSTTCHWHPFYKCFFDELLNSSYNAEGEYIFLK